MRRSFFALRKNREGATAIEFALVAPLLFLLIFGTIEYGIIMFVSSVVEGGTANAARMAKTGVGRSTDSNPEARAAQDRERIENLILERGGNLLDRDNLEVIMTPASVETGANPDGLNTVGGAGEMVTYTSTYTWNVLTPIMRQFLGDDEGQIRLRAVTVVYNEPYDD